MNHSPNHPYYKHTPIKSIQALSRALKIDTEHLIKVADNAETLWKLPFELKKEDGSSRTILDATAKLKAIHRRIHSEILSHVHYPSYITGSVKGFDYSANAAIHVNKSIVIAEDIKSFFPSTTTILVHAIWEEFFGFSYEVAQLLTKLTTKSGCLPQGGICSSYLANLAFWDVEPYVVIEFKKIDIDYSRYVDDISASSKAPLDKKAKTQVINKLYGMLIKKGYKPKRTKHEIHTQKNPMIVTKLVVNGKVSLNKDERSNIRTAVFQLESRVRNGERGIVIASELTHTAGRVGVLNRFHKVEGAQLKARLKVLRNILSNCPIQNTTSPTKPIKSFNSDEVPF